MQSGIIREWRESTFPWEDECVIEEPEGDGELALPAISVHDTDMSNEYM